jgi:uncharacterized protein YbaR (Trm112 family)
MNKCPNCKTEKLNLIDTSENIIYPSEEIKAECAKWEQWECEECESILDIEEGIITVLEPVGVNENRIKFRVTTDWERKIEESYSYD